MSQPPAQPLEGLDPLIQGLLRPEAYDHPVSALELLETHISWVILTGDFAYKIKKPVNFGFVDFTTIEKRHHFCDEELRLNRRQTRDLYLAVKPIFASNGQPSFVGTGSPIDYAVQMRQFSQSDLLPAVLARGELRGEHLDRLAIDIARFQAAIPSAAPDSEYGSGPVIRKAMDANLATLDNAPRVKDSVDALRDWTAQEFLRCEPEFARRRAAKKIREGHGDLHLGNMILCHGEIEVFDCIEFNPEFRWIDLISDVAFLVMDLVDRGAATSGWRFLNAWLSETGDYSGLGVWAWYFTYRALVRAKVAVLRGQQADVTAAESLHLERQMIEYVDLARRTAFRPQPTVIVTHGLSGSGKSFWAQRIASACGAVWIRSDVERKRLFAEQHQTGEQPSPALYSRETTLRTYRHLVDLAGQVLASGWPVLVDATCLARWQRDLFRDLSQSLGVNALLLSFTADPATLRERIRTRRETGGDPSDATEAVLANQLNHLEPVSADEGWNTLVIDANRPPEEPALLASITSWQSSPDRFRNRPTTD